MHTQVSLKKKGSSSSDQQCKKTTSQVTNLNHHVQTACVTNPNVEKTKTLLLRINGPISPEENNAFTAYKKKVCSQHREDTTVLK
jgi:hypothetical protein